MGIFGLEVGRKYKLAERLRFSFLPGEITENLRLKGARENTCLKGGAVFER